MNATKCIWSYADNEFWDRWDTTCGTAYSFYTGNPKDNNYNYCPSCGKELLMITERISQIEAELNMLTLGNDDVRTELLREREELLNGVTNKTDQELIREWFSPPRFPEL